MDEDFKKLRRKKDNQTLVPLYPIPAGVGGYYLFEKLVVFF